MFTRDIGMGGRQFTEEIQRTMNISYEDAETMKVGDPEMDERAIVPEEVEQVLVSVGESLATEIQRSLDFYLSTASDSGLAGSTSRVVRPARPVLREHFAPNRPAVRGG